MKSRCTVVAISCLLVAAAGCGDDTGGASDLAVGLDLSASGDDLAVAADMRYTGIGFMPPPAPVTDMGGVCPFSVAAAVDVDGDGKLDVVAERPYVAFPPLLGWCRGDGQGGLAATTPYPANNFFYEQGVEMIVADLDHAGRPDLLLSTQDCCHNSSPSKVFALHDLGASNFTVGASLASPFVGLGAPRYAVAVADFDEDGNVDFVAADAPDDVGDGNTVVRFGNGDATFRDGGTLGRFMWVGAGDFDGDHHADLVSCHYASLAYTTCELRRGNGHGAFAAPVAVALGAPVADQSGNRVVDVDGDGALDLVVSAADHVAVNFGAGDGSFAGFVTATFPAAMPAWRHDVRVADVDGDGKLELITYGAAISVYRVARGAAGDGGTGGTLTLVQRTPSVNTGSQIALGDFDGDGRVDVATGDGIMLNSGVWP